MCLRKLIFDYFCGFLKIHGHPVPFSSPKPQKSPKINFLGCLRFRKDPLFLWYLCFFVSRQRQNLHTQSIFCNDILLSLRCVLTFQVASFCKSTITSYLNILESGHENCIEFIIHIV